MNFEGNLLTELPIARPMAWPGFSPRVWGVKGTHWQGGTGRNMVGGNGMSRKYNHDDRVPNEVLAKRLEELAEAVTKPRDSEEFLREFTMRVPAELDRDADLVISEAANRIRELEALTIAGQGNKQ